MGNLDKNDVEVFDPGNRISLYADSIELTIYVGAEISFIGGKGSDKTLPQMEIEIARQLIKEAFPNAYWHQY